MQDKMSNLKNIIRIEKKVFYAIENIRRQPFATIN